MASTEKRTELIQAARGFNNVPWCEDYEKMISGMLYNPLAPSLVTGRHRAHKWAAKYNAYFPDDSTAESLEADRAKMLSGILGRFGTSAYIEAPFYIDYGCNISIGDRFYANFNLVILDCSLVTIGNNVMLGPFVSIFSATHETAVQSRRDCIEYALPVVIGDDCWIGGQTVILPGVTIGKGCTIGAGSVVSKDIPPWSVAMGSPARVIKKVSSLEEQGIGSVSDQ